MSTIFTIFGNPHRLSGCSSEWLGWVGLDGFALQPCTKNSWMLIFSHKKSLLMNLSGLKKRCLCWIIGGDPTFTRGSFFFFDPRWKLLSPGNASSLREPRRLQCCVELSRNETNITFPCFHECQPDIARSIWEHLQYFAIISLCTCWMLLPMFLKAGDVERNQNCGQLCKPLLVRFCQTSPLHWCLRWTRWNRQVFLKNSTAMIHYDMSGI